MIKRSAKLVAAGVASVALAVPSVGLATKGGTPHSKKPCPAHRHSGKHHGAGKGRKRGSARGKKCGR